MRFLQSNQLISIVFTSFVDQTQVYKLPRHVMLKQIISRIIWGFSKKKCHKDYYFISRQYFKYGRSEKHTYVLNPMERLGCFF